MGGGRESFLAVYSFFFLSAVIFFGIEMDVKGDLPVVCGREGCHWHSEARGRDFGDIEVVASQKADGNLGGGTMSAAARVRDIYIYISRSKAAAVTYEEIEQKDKKYRSNLSGLVRSWETVGDGECCHAHGHAESAKHEELAASKAIDGEEGDE